MTTTESSTPTAEQPTKPSTPSSSMHLHILLADNCMPTVHADTRPVEDVVEGGMRSPVYLSLGADIDGFPWASMLLTISTRHGDDGLRELCKRILAALDQIPPLPPRQGEPNSDEEDD
jgi:hypothetical protein